MDSNRKRSDFTDVNDNSKKIKGNGNVKEIDYSFMNTKSEVGKLMKNMNWSCTPFGPISEWPQSLLTAVSILMNSDFPMILFWGPDLLQIYNDAYCFSILGSRHPTALCQPASECWPEIWHIIGPSMKGVVSTGVAMFAEDQLLNIISDGILQERYFTYSYSPMFVEGSKIENTQTKTRENITTLTGGVFAAVRESTSRVIGERQLQVLREVASHSTEAINEVETCKILAKSMTTDPGDIPYALLYLVESDGNVIRLTLIDTVGIDKGQPYSPLLITSEDDPHKHPESLSSKFLKCVQLDVTDVMDMASYDIPPCGLYTQTPLHCVALPLHTSAGVSGLLVCGVNPRHILTDSYKTFFNLIAAQASTNLANARSREQDRKKAEMLAEIDRAKTLFFSNISHEFRTPLTLMLGPLEDVLQRERRTSSPNVEQLELVHRNTLRLLKLVNSLLDFSRIEAGRVQAHYEPVDVSFLTANLASVFRSACDKAGLHYTVDCVPIEGQVYVDVDMWEKIVMNLISNAYKYTLHGGISVKLFQSSINSFQLVVTDTGCGIPEEEYNRVFERFHRIQSGKGRTHEGTGIGLAMVSELVKLHGGSISLASEVDKGSTFTVTLPLGYEHLPYQNVSHVSSVETDRRRSSYTRTAEWWTGKDTNDITNLELSNAPEDRMDIETKPNRLYTVLIVDDNADMREYIVSLLKHYYTLEIACDGIEALEKISQKIPDIVVTDIMMPRLDGIGLLQKIREKSETKTIPVIFLSARVGMHFGETVTSVIFPGKFTQFYIIGEENKVEGLQSGADDYLVKPFAARELLARINTHLQLNVTRNEVARIAEQANKAKDMFLAVLSHELRTPLTPALMLAETLEKNSDLPIKVRKDLEIISRNIKLEVRLIDDLLDVTKITKNKLVLNMTTVDAHSELEHTIDLVHHDASDKNILLSVQLQAEDHVIEADMSRLQQVFWNIIKNAVKFTPPGGSIYIDTINENNTFKLKVRDTGIGIESDSLSKIFQSFQQANSKIVQQFGGLGLGLSISKALTNMMNGTIVASSDGHGTGSMFTVTFPTTKNPRKALQTVNSNHSITAQRILLVEDNKSTALVMTRFLKKLGHNVTTAYCVQGALDVAKTNTFDLVVSDVGLPDGSGFDLMKQLKTLYNLRGVCVTGYGMEEDVQKSKDSGFAVHIVKPVEMDSLKSALHYVVNSSL